MYMHRFIQLLLVSTTQLNLCIYYMYYVIGAVCYIFFCCAHSFWLGSFRGFIFHFYEIFIKLHLCYKHLISGHVLCDFANANNNEIFQYLLAALFVRQFVCNTVDHIL